MTILKSTNAEGSQDVTISVDNLQQFVDQYSPEFVQGYAQAISDGLVELRKLINDQSITARSVPLPDSRIARNMNIFHNQKNELVNQFIDMRILHIAPNDTTKLG